MVLVYKLAVPPIVLTLESLILPNAATVNALLVPLKFTSGKLKEFVLLNKLIFPVPAALSSEFALATIPLALAIFAVPVR